ncbi:MAG: hypothetical protein I4N51_05785 [Acinetobacter sp.]|nr:hypothetical protein [Acinetobacter sp.]
MGTKPKGRRTKLKVQRPPEKGVSEASKPEKLISSSTLILRFVDAIHDVKDDFHEWITDITW